MEPALKPVNSEEEQRRQTHTTFASRLLFGLLVGGERVVQFRNALLKLVHHQRPVFVEERRHRLGEVRLSRLLGLPVGEGHPERVLVVKPGKHRRKLIHSESFADEEMCRLLGVAGLIPILTDRLREEESCQMWSGSIPAGSFCMATRKMFFSL